MKFRSLLLIAVFCAGWLNVQSQSDKRTMDSLLFWGDVMTNAGMAEHRLMAQEHFQNKLLQHIRNTADFSGTLDSVPWISIQIPPNDSFRLITWQWNNEEGVIVNQGVFQFRGDTSLIVLRDLKRQIGRPQTRTLRAPQWIGARYFKMIPFQSEGDTVYVLLGYDGFSDKETVQVIDFLRIKDDGPVFGGGFLRDSSRDLTLDRRILRYMEGAQVKVTYDKEKQRIVFDHLRRIDHPGMPGGSSWIPDGTYEAYQLSDGYWRYDEKVYQRILDEPPVNRPEGRDEDKDIFGRPQNGQ